jgi:hypothetical protein
VGADAARAPLALALAEAGFEALFVRESATLEPGFDAVIVAVEGGAGEDPVAEVRAIRSRALARSVLVAAGESAINLAADAIVNGADGFFALPATPAELCAAIEGNPLPPLAPLPPPRPPGAFVLVLDWDPARGCHMEELLCEAGHVARWLSSPLFEADGKKAPVPDLVLANSRFAADVLARAQPGVRVAIFGEPGEPIDGLYVAAATGTAPILFAPFSDAELLEFLRCALERS